MRKSGPRISERNGISLIELFQMFPNDEAAEKWFENERWPNGIFCPDCGSVRYSDVKNKKPMPYRCKDCRKHFSVRKGTVMQSSKLGLQKWGIAIYMVATSLKGVSSMKLHRDLKVRQPTAWYLAQRIRQGFVDGNEVKLGGIVEVDETYIGGKEKNKHSHKKLRAGRGPVGKTAVIGAKQRDGKIKAQPIQCTDGLTLKGFVIQCVENKATVYTDEHKGYKGLQGMFEYESVKRSVGEYVNGMAHTNGIESFWALLKRGYHGTYHHMSAKHLHRYVSEFAGRHNIRGKDTMDQINAIFSGMVGKQLRYLDLVAG